MKFFIALLLPFMLLTSCKSSQNGGKVKVPADFSLELRHQGCRGNCPDYIITVDAEGNATYQGNRAVEMMGKYTKKVDQKVVKELISALEEAKFWDMDESYGGGVADLPTVYTSVTMDGNSKRVEDIRNAPKELKELEAKLESLIGKDGWVAQ